VVRLDLDDASYVVIVVDVGLSSELDRAEWCGRVLDAEAFHPRRSGTPRGSWRRRVVGCRSGW